MDDWERQFLLGMLGEQSQLVREHVESIRRAAGGLPMPVATGLVVGSNSFMVGIQATHRLMLGCLAGEERPTLDDALVFLVNQGGSNVTASSVCLVVGSGHTLATLTTTAVGSGVSGSAAATITASGIGAGIGSGSATPTLVRSAS